MFDSLLNYLFYFRFNLFILLNFFIMIDYFYFFIIVIYLFHLQRSQIIYFNQSNYSIYYLFDCEFNYLFYFFVDNHS